MFLGLGLGLGLGLDNEVRVRVWRLGLMFHLVSDMYPLMSVTG